MYIYNIYTYNYIYPLRLHGFASTGITFSYTREKKTHQVENQIRTRTVVPTTTNSHSNPYPLLGF
jgi:hypothetical protein